MGKRIIQQARGHGSLSYRSKKKAYRISVSYPSINEEGDAFIEKIFNVACYSAPIAKINFKGKVFYNISSKDMYEGQIIKIGKNAEVEQGNIVPLEILPIGTNVFNIEIRPGEGGKLVRTSGISAKILRKDKGRVILLMPSKKEIAFDQQCRATIGIIAASGRVEKPILKAGKMFHIMKARGARVYPRTSAVKMNVVDHPFGSGRGKRIKSKIAKRNAPPGAKVGLLSPKKTGRRK